ncbi:MAG: undecaprenyl-diphosphatase UppP [Parcubacteria group bacterium Gr01-1014_38]|nr:MAG: undecaprenyl-diphosphatase UppP [Parcubacteria group bacterium Gr01-1014_38]
MELLRAVVLGVVQGITEFLPVSSDGHLLLARYVFGWADEGLAFDAALHLGTFLAVLVYFRRTWIALVRGRDAPLFWALVLGTLPAALVGVAAQRLLAEEFRSLLVTGLSFLATAALLFLADRRAQRSSVLEVTPPRGFLIGCAQIFALLPGLSRSGVTMAAGIFAGLSRERAVEFSFLLALPITAAAGAEGVRSTLGAGVSLPLAIGVLAAFLSGVVAIGAFLRLIRTQTFLPYVLYLLVVGGALLLRLR